MLAIKHLDTYLEQDQGNHGTNRDHAQIDYRIAHHGKEDDLADSKSDDRQNQYGTKLLGCCDVVDFGGNNNTHGYADDRNKWDQQEHRENKNDGKILTSIVKGCKDEP